MKKLMFTVRIVLLFPYITAFLFLSCSKDNSEPEDENPAETIGAWTKLNKGVSLPGWESLYCFQNEDSVYAIFQDGALFSFSQTDINVSQKTSFPKSGNTGTVFAAIPLSNKFYIFNTFDDSIYTYHKDQWSLIGGRPLYTIQYGGPMFGLPYSNSIYLFMSKISTSYDLLSGVWTPKAEIPEYYEDENHTNHVVYEGGLMAGTSLNNRVFILLSGGDIFEYDFENDQWLHITKYPGTIMEKIVYFSKNNKIYVGLSHVYRGDSYNRKWLENELWSFDINSEIWTEEQNIPFDLEYGKVLTYFHDNKLYFGHAPLTKHYHLYSFDTVTK